MITEEPTMPEDARLPIPSGPRLPSFLQPQSLQDVRDLAAVFCAANWVPHSYRDKDGRPDQAKVEVGIMFGLELGLTPNAALQSIAVINNMPSIYGDGMLALVLARGLIEDFQESYTGQGEELTAVCTIKRKGRPTPIVGKFSVAMAKRAGLWTKKGPWQDYPARMLKMRARAWALRDGFADVLRGMHITEEVLDMVPIAESSYALPPRPRPEDFADSLSADVSDVPQADTAVDGKTPETAERAVERAKRAAPPAEPQARYMFVDFDGNIVEHTSASAACSEFEATMKTAAGISSATLEGMWEMAGDFLSSLRSTGRDKAADMLGERYAELLADAEARERRAFEEQNAKAAAQKPPPSPAPAPQAANKPAAAPPRQVPRHADAEPLDDDVTAPALPRWTFKLPDYKQPTSPLKGGNWLAFIGWFSEMIANMPADEIADFLSEQNFGREYDELHKKRPGDAAEIDRIIAARKTR